VVELAVLERLCAGNRTEGSNPSPSARSEAARQLSGRFSSCRSERFEPRVRRSEATCRGLLRAWLSREA
jgi:hypothetical protein